MSVTDLQNETIEYELARVNRERPHWRAFMSVASSVFQSGFYATRRGKVRATEVQHPDWALTVEADSIPELEEKMSYQDTLDN